jgi:hypothetical protein
MHRRSTSRKCGRRWSRQRRWPLAKTSCDPVGLLDRRRHRLTAPLLWRVDRLSAATRDGGFSRNLAVAPPKSSYQSRTASTSKACSRGRAFRRNAPSRRPPVVHQPEWSPAIQRSRSARRHRAVPGPSSRGAGNLGSARRNSSMRRTLTPRYPATCVLSSITASGGGGAGRDILSGITCPPDSVLQSLQQSIRADGVVARLRPRLIGRPGT